MRSSGIVRRIDELGRIVLPIETRRMLDINPKDGVEIFIEDDKVILRKYMPCCIFCNNADNVTYYRDKRICRDCLEELKAQK